MIIKKKYSNYINVIGTLIKITTIVFEMHVESE